MTVQSLLPDQHALDNQAWSACPTANIRGAHLRASAFCPLISRACMEAAAAGSTFPTGKGERVDRTPLPQPTPAAVLPASGTSTLASCASAPHHTPLSFAVSVLHTSALGD